MDLIRDESHEGQLTGLGRFKLSWGNFYTVGLSVKTVEVMASWITSLEHYELSNDDDDGSEIVAKKLNLPPFKCYRVYLELLNLSNVGEFLRTLSRFRKEKENSSSYVHFLYNVAIGGFTS